MGEIKKKKKKKLFMNALTASPHRGYKNRAMILYR